jgi:hypothetical protein
VTVAATQGPAGSYLPSVCISGDSNTGFGQVGGQSDTASIFTAGAERVRVGSTGRVGIPLIDNFVLFAVNHVATGQTTQIGIQVSPTILTDVTNQFIHFRSNTGFPATALTINDVIHCQAVMFSSPAAGSTIGKVVGFVATGSLGGKATTTYGFEANIAAAANTWNVYASGTAQNWFAGNVGIGASRTAPATALDVNGDVTITDKILHSGDTDTAIRFPANDAVAVETGGSERLRVKATGAVRFVPLAADPASGEAGDVYYNSANNKLRVYNGTSWVDLH